MTRIRPRCWPPTWLGWTGQVWFLVTGELVEFGDTARTPRPGTAPPAPA